MIMMIFIIMALIIWHLMITFTILGLLLAKPADTAAATLVGFLVKDFFKKIFSQRLF